MNKPKTLPSSLRDKKRYVVFRVVSDASPDPDALAEMIYETAMELFGEVGMAKGNLWVMKRMYDAEKKIGMVRCSPGFVEECRLILSSVTQIDEVRCILNVLGVTGTIRTAKIKYYG